MNRHLRQLLSDIAQTDPAVEMHPGFLAARAAANGDMPPLTESERAAFRSLVVAEMARAEKRRIPQPQLEFGHV
jgi:hypothetical protein